MQCLQVQLILCLLANQFQIGAERGFGNSFRVVVIVLLTLNERLGIWLE